jgi:hypothetical protein
MTLLVTQNSVVPKDCMKVNNKLSGVWKEAIMA